MKLAQTLYENGHITYMRTDSTTYSKDFVKSAKDYIKKQYGIKYVHENIDKLVNNSSNKKSKKE